MNPPYSMPPGPSPVISYSQPSQPQPSNSFNGYESHNLAVGYNQSQIPPGKGYPPGPYAPVNSNVQNGPVPRPPFTGGGNMPFSQNMSSPLLSSVPTPPPPSSTNSTNQMTQRMEEMNLNQNKSPMYQPPSSGPGLVQRPPGSMMTEMFQPPGPRQPSQQPMTFSGQPPPANRYAPPPSNAPITQQPMSYGLQDSGRGPMQNEGGKFQMSGQGLPSNLPPAGTGLYNNVVGPPAPMSQNMPPTLNVAPVSNGMYYPGNELQQSSPNMASYNNQVNGPMMSPSMYPATQMPPPMQARYPPPNSMAAMPPPPPPTQQQYSSTGNPPNRMPAPAMAPAPAAQTRRLDPENMPSPIQVIEDDKKLHNSAFQTNTRGQVPPLVTTDFVVSDGGICNPRFIRSTIYTVPTTADILKQTAVPFSLVLSPFAELHEGEYPPPVSDPGDGQITGYPPVRCNRCKAYMCPFMQFIDGGRRFQCIFCKATTEVPAEYFAHLDHMGERVDKFQRPELCLGSYEFIATKEYCKNSTFPNDPAFIFIIDVSYNSIRSGLLQLLCNNMKEVLAQLPREVGDLNSKIKIGFITYSNVVHFYNAKSALAQPQMMVVSDIQDMFMPLLDGFLVDYIEAEQIIDCLLQELPGIFLESRDTETILGPAIQAGLEALKAANCSGKLFVFHTTLPIAEAPGKLKNRDDRKLLGTEKEKTILCPQSAFYNNLGQECVAAGCCVDLFLFPNAYIDIATIGQVCRLSGGQLYKYTYFQADIDGARFLADLKRDVSKPIAFDAVIRVRTSTGIRPTDFWGNFFMSNTTDIEVAAIDCDKAIAVEIKYDDKLGEEDGAYIQAAILFTSCGGQRRLRIHNLALNTSSQMSDLFRSCELDTIMNAFSKEAVRMITEQTPHQVKDHFISRSAQILACYRKNCANRSSVGQLILPECMKLLPLYINCLIKSEAIAGGQEMSTDDRSFVMLALNSMNVESSACYLYPRLLSLHDLPLDTTDLPVAIRCSIEKIKDTGAYLIENGLSIILWIGVNCNPEWIEDVFGVQSVSRIDIDKTKLVDLNTPLSKRICEIIKKIQNERQRNMKMIIVRQGDKHEILFRQMLVEDRTTEGSASYVDFLCHLHKEIRQLLT